MLDWSKELINRAIIDYKPKAIVLMLSGGDDSMAAYHVSKELGIKIDFVIHGNTRTGIALTTDFAIKEAERMGDKLLIADAGNSYTDYVLRKGFFGKGTAAHIFSYHVWKSKHFERVISKHIRKGRRNFPILFLNGARRLESENRKKTMLNPIRIGDRRPNDIWVNIINEFDNDDCKIYLEGNGIKRNPVSINLCRSGECMCGTMQSKGDRVEAGYFYPDWKKWIDNLEKEVMQRFPWSWNDNINKQHIQELGGQMNMFSDFQPMCTGCKINYKEELL
jgi:3'-phosphoadenosine 5'-phosphosulfate sulfotransferase (PAPS reductase)/FAD synthetase